ncbi:TPA: hypothetical protein ACFP4Q_002094 [Neisseria weaveri]
MKVMNVCRKYGAKVASVTTMAVLPALAMANGDTNLLQTASTEVGALKTGIIAFGVIVIGIAIALATIGIAKRAINKA